MLPDMDPPGPTTAVLILRAWAERDPEAALRFRITESLDLDATETRSVVTTSIVEVVDAVERWTQEWARRATDR